MAPRLHDGEMMAYGKTLEAGILVSELIAHGRGRRILVLALKSMISQFQNEFWNRFTIPLTRLDSVGIQRVRSRIPTNHNPFYYFDKAIFSIDTLKHDAEYRTYIEQRIRRRNGEQQKSPDDAVAEEIATLQELQLALEGIAGEDYAKYQALLRAICKAEPFAWDGSDPADRLVIFTERIETLRRLAKRLVNDLKLAKGALEVLYGTMSDVEQQRVVRISATRSAPSACWCARTSPPRGSTCTTSATGSSTTTCHGR